MKVRMFLFGLLLASALAGSGPPPKPNALRGNEIFPWRDVQESVDPTIWNAICDLEYSAFIVMDGAVNGSGQVKIRETVKSFPDRKHEAQAVALGNKVVMRQRFTGDSRVLPRARVWVIFYENFSDGVKLAVTITKRVDAGNVMRDRTAIVTVERY